MQLWIILAGILHLAFAVCELFPWANPLLLRIVSKNLPDIDDGSSVGNDNGKAVKFSPHQQSLVATIVHNAGIYNVIVAGGLFWAAYRGQPAYEVAVVLLVGATVAGVFGTVTLKSPVTAIQAVLGLAGAIVIGRSILM